MGQKCPVSVVAAVGLARPRLPGVVGELDGLGRRTRQGTQELKALREETGAVLAAFGT